MFRCYVENHGTRRNYGQSYRMNPSVGDYVDQKDIEEILKKPDEKKISKRI